MKKFLNLVFDKNKVRYHLGILFVAYTASAFAQIKNEGNKITGSSTPYASIKPPSQTGEVGYNTLVFSDDFDSINSIDVNSTDKTGFNWYVGLPFGGPDTKPSAFSVSNSVLNLTKAPRNYNWAISSYSIKKNHGHTFRYGYFEARIRFDPSLGKISKGFPAWWALSTAYSRVDTMFHSEKWAELDFFEAYTNGYSNFDSSFVGTVHDWADSAKIHYQNKHNIQKLPSTVNFNQWHTYGCLWEPGKITWYFDGVALMTQKYSASAPPDPLPNAGDNSPVPPPAGTFTILDTDPQGLLIILGSDPNWPMYVDWVRVWQNESKKL